MNPKDVLEGLAAEVTAVGLLLAEQRRYQEPLREPVSRQAKVSYHGFGCRKFQIGWHLTKTGCPVRFPKFVKKTKYK